MNKRLIHPDMVESLPDFFPSICTIQEAAESNNVNTNEIEYTWSNLFSGVNCTIGRDTTLEKRMPDKTVTTSTHRIVLMGLYAVTEAMRVVIGSDAYNILNVENDEQSVKTSLVVEKVSL